MVDGSDTEPLCHIANSPAEQILMCQKLMNTPFSANEEERRKNLLLSSFANSIQADIISKLI
jgi:hypothetical protein